MLQSRVWYLMAQGLVNQFCLFKLSPVSHDTSTEFYYCVCIIKTFPGIIDQWGSYMGVSGMIHGWKKGSIMYHRYRKFIFLNHKINKSTKLNFRLHSLLLHQSVWRVQNNIVERLCKGFLLQIAYLKLLSMADSNH